MHEAPTARRARGDRTRAALVAAALELFERKSGNRDDWLRILCSRRTLNAIILPIVQRGRTDGSLRTDLSPQRLAQGLTILWLDAVVGWAERDVALDLAVDLRRATSLFVDGAAA